MNRPLEIHLSGLQGISNSFQGKESLESSKAIGTIPRNGGFP